METKINKHSKSLSFLIACIISIPTFGQRVINIGVQVSPGNSSVKASFPSSMSDVESKGSININYRITGQYFLTKTYGVASGLEVLNFNQTTLIGEYYEGFNSTDSEGALYERRVWSKDVKEKTSLTIIHLPIQLFYHYTFNRTIALYGSFGPGVSIPISSKLNANGVFTYKGYYPNDKVLLSDIPIYGFSSDFTLDKKTKVKTNPIMFDIGASLGISLTLSRFYRFNTAFGYYQTITNTAQKDDEYHMSNDIGSYYSVLNSGRNLLRNMWLSVGFSKNILF